MPRPEPELWRGATHHYTHATLFFIYLIRWCMIYLSSLLFSYLAIDQWGFFSLLTEVSMCLNQSMAFDTYVALTPTDIYWSRKLDCPSKFHTGHFPYLQRNILSALAKVLRPLSSVVTMTSGVHRSWLGHFYRPSGLHINDQSFLAIVKSNVVIYLKDSIVGLYRLHT